MKVYIAWYRNGFTDSSPVKLGVFAEERAASEATRDHKRTRDRLFEYRDRARWEVDLCEEDK